MSPQAQENSFGSEDVGSQLLQSVATELAIFCVTITVAVVLKVTAFSSGGCAASFRNFWPTPQHQPRSKLPPSPSKEASLPASPGNERLAAAPRNAQANSARRPAPRSATQGAARLFENIISNKNASEALALYADMRSNDVHLQAQALLRSTRFSPLDFYSALVQSAVRAGQPHLVEQLLDDMASARVERTLSFYESAMKVLAGKKHYRQALAVYSRLDAEGFKASPVTFSCLINFAAELGDFDSAIGFFEQLASTSMPSIRAYMVALRVYSKRQDWTKSLEIFRSMQERGVKIDSLIFNAVLATGVAAGKTDAAEELLHEVAVSSGDIVDVISYNTVLKGYAHQKVAGRALKILDLMLERGVKPNGITFNTAMDAAIRGSQSEDAWHILERMHEDGIRPDKYTCTILLKGLHEDSTPKQLSQLIDMIHSALPHCDSTLRSSLFRGIVQVAAQMSNAALLMRAFAQMQGQYTFTIADYQLILQTLAQQCHAAHCSTIWRHILSPARVGSQRPAATATALTLFTAIMEELARKEHVEAMICTFESLRTVVTETEPQKLAVAQKVPESHGQQLLQQCRAALMQAASRKQHSCAAFKRLLELAPQQGLSPETLMACA